MYEFSQDSTMASKLSSKLENFKIHEESSREYELQYI